MINHIFQERKVDDIINDLATDLAPVQMRLAPDSYHNMTAFEKEAQVINWKYQIK